MDTRGQGGTLHANRSRERISSRIFDDHVVQEAQARQAGLYLLRFEHPFKLEKLHGIARADSESVYPAPSSPGETPGYLTGHNFRESGVTPIDQSGKSWRFEVRIHSGDFTKMKIVTRPGLTNL